MTLKEITEKINHLENKLEAAARREDRISVVQHELDQLRKELMKSNRKMKKEKADVEALESKNLKSLFTEILGDREQQLEKERQEYLQEVLRHNRMIDEIEVLEYEEYLLRSKRLYHQKKQQETLDQLYDLKERILLDENKNNHQLMEFERQRQIHLRREKEIREALDESLKLEQKLHTIIHNLKHVKQWGPYRMQGKGRYSSINKKTYIDKANREAILANVLIKKFDKELKDLFPDMDPALSMKQFRDFLDVFYDHLITDWMIQKKLDNAIFSIRIMMDKLARIKMMLEKDEEVQKMEKEKISRAKRSFLRKT